MNIVLTLTGIALASFAASGLVTVIAVGVAEIANRNHSKEDNHV